MYDLLPWRIVVGLGTELYLRRQMVHARVPRPQFPDNDRSLSEAARQKELNAGEWSERGASDRVVRRKRLRGDLGTTSYGF
jgi:hypothetical protein